MRGQNVSCEFGGGGGKRTVGGGVQDRFEGGVLWYVFPSPEFSTPPLCFSLKNSLDSKVMDRG